VKTLGESDDKGSLGLEDGLQGLLGSALEGLALHSWELDVGLGVLTGLAAENLVSLQHAGLDDLDALFAGAVLSSDLAV